MKTKLLIYTTGLLLMVLAAACKKENLCDCVKRTGKIVTKTREASGFTCIQLEDKIDLYLYQGPEFEVKVEAGENLQKLIRTTVEGETLKVVNDNKCNWVRGYKHKIRVYVTAPYFKFIAHRGVGTIETPYPIAQTAIGCKTYSSGDIHLNLQGGTARCSAFGNGDIYLQGEIDQLEHDYEGTNFLYAQNLVVHNYVYLRSVSVGHAYVNAPLNGQLDVRIERSGNVYYAGSPLSINLVRNSKGDLIKEN